MSQTVFQQVANAVADAIDGVVAGASYSHTLTAIRPKTLNIGGDETADGAALITITSVTEVVDQNMDTHESQSWLMDMKVEIAGVQSDSSTDPIEDRLSQMAADAWKAVYATVDRGVVLGGLAKDVNLKGIDFMMDPKGTFASCAFEVLVWTAFGDLYSVA